MSALVFHFWTATIRATGSNDTTVYGHLGDKPTGRQTTGRQANWATTNRRHVSVNWATTSEVC